jgi:hypothetical protein
MKMLKGMSANEAIQFLNAIHTKSRDLGAPEHSYIAVLYTTADVNVESAALPPGSLLVRPGALLRLLEPLGISPVLQVLQEKVKQN